MPLVRMGNIAAKEGFREEVAEKDLEELMRMAEAEVVRTDDLKGSKAEKVRILQERLSSLVRYRPIEGRQITTVAVPDGTPLLEALNTIVAAGDGVWDHHSDAPPAWIESDNKVLEAALAEHYACEIGMPKDWPGPAGADWGTTRVQHSADYSEADREDEEKR